MYIVSVFHTVYNLPVAKAEKNTNIDGVFFSHQISWQCGVRDCQMKKNKNPYNLKMKYFFHLAWNWRTD